MKTETFAERLAKYRQASSLSLRALGARSGVSFQFVGELERGEKGPSLATAQKLARALRIGLEDLAGTDSA